MKCLLVGIVSLKLNSLCDQSHVISQQEQSNEGENEGEETTTEAPTGKVPVDKKGFSKGETKAPKKVRFADLQYNTVEPIQETSLMR